MRVKKHLKEYLTFNKSERRGLFILSAIILLLILVNFAKPLFVRSKSYDYSSFEKEVNDFLKTMEITTKKPKTLKQKENFDIYFTNRSSTEQKLNPFPFDPNTLEYEKWIEMGLTAKQAKSIINYREKGGKFRNKEDFSKLYVISKEEYQILEPYIEITPQEKPVNFKRAPSKENILTADINTSSEEELMKIKGIGKYFAEKIVKYRWRLGGYYDLRQLLEIPKMDSVKFQEIQPYLTVTKEAIQKINVNTATFEQLKAHPYIGYNIALSLINYRTNHGKFNHVSDIKKSALINEKNYEKISHYICIE